MYTDMLCNKMYMICAMWGKKHKTCSESYSYMIVFYPCISVTVMNVTLYIYLKETCLTIAST